MGMLRVFVLGALGLVAGCAPNVAAMSAERAVASSRGTLNQVKRECMLPLATTACDRLGTLAMHADAQSMSRAWTEPVDRQLAAQAFARGCKNGDGASCRDLVELGVASSDDEEDWASRRAAYFMTAVRSAKQVAVLHAKEAAKARVADRASAEADAKLQAEFDQQYAQAWAQAGSAAVSAGGNAFRYASRANADTKTILNSKMGLAPRVSAGIDLANATSELATGRPAIGEGGTLVNVCVPCVTQAKALAGACASKRSAGCQRATTALATCLGENSCDE